MDIVGELVGLIDGKGHRQYGLSHLNQRAHALQAALLAEQAGCPPALITASLLHDIGHLLHVLSQWLDDAALQQRILVDNPALLYGFASV